MTSFSLREFSQSSRKEVRSKSSHKEGGRVDHLLFLGGGSGNDEGKEV